MRQAFPGAPIRGYVKPGNEAIVDQCRPVNLTETEDWVWLRLEEFGRFWKCRQKGSKRAAKLNLEMKIEIASVDDLSEIQAMIEELAIYENMLDQCQMTVDKLREDYTLDYVAKGMEGSMNSPKYYATVAKLNGKIIGYTASVDFFTLENGKETYLEDLFIREEYRRQGLGSILLYSVWEEAKKRHSRGLYWVCRAWNKSSMDLYHSLGAKDQDVTFIRFEADQEYWFSMPENWFLPYMIPLILSLIFRF